MKTITKIISLGFTIILIVSLSTYVGYKTNQMTIGIIIGFVMALAYLIKEVIKHD